MVKEEQAKATPERKKLTLTSVGTVAKVNDYEKLAFKAKDESGKEFVYSCFNSKLFTVIQQDIGKVVEFEVITSTSGEFTNRKIVQAYVNGQPVAPVQKGFSGGRSFGKSPQEIRAERISIESQTAVKAITDLEVAGKSVKPELIVLRDTCEH